LNRSYRELARHEGIKIDPARILVVDDTGLCPLVGDEPVDLYEMIRRRYERGSTISMSNRALKEWPPLFGDMPEPAGWQAQGHHRKGSVAGTWIQFAHDLAKQIEDLVGSTSTRCGRPRRPR
jgi:hypothetical protein